jgi:hypothetical protein
VDSHLRLVSPIPAYPIHLDAVQSVGFGLKEGVTLLHSGEDQLQSPPLRFVSSEKRVRSTFGPFHISYTKVGANLARTEPLLI